MKYYRRIALYARILICALCQPSAYFGKITKKVIFRVDKDYRVGYK